MIFPKKTKKIGKCRAVIGRQGKPLLDFKRSRSIRYKKKDWIFSRLSFHLNVRKIPNSPMKSKGVWIKGVGLICHHCDHKWCVEPSHLYYGDHKTNGRDYGQRMPVEHRERKSIKAKETQASPEYRKKMSLACRGIPRTKAWREAHRKAALRRLPPTEATRNKMSLSAKRRCARMGKFAMNRKMKQMRMARGS